LANVAIATGAGLVVLDHDPRSGGDDGLATLRAEHGDLPATPTVRTGSGGTHWYFAHRGGRVGNRAGLYPGIDVRADGGFVVAPPSVHRSGNRYEWMRGAAMLAPVPEWLIAACRPAPPAATRLPQLRLDEMSATFRRMSAWLAHTERSIQGQNGSAALMRALGKIVAQGLGGDDEWTLVVEYNATMCDPPWSVAELVHALGNARRERRGTRLEERRWASP
jgi:putative DNA primase/helicase